MDKSPELRHRVFSKKERLFNLSWMTLFLTREQREELLSELRLERNRKYADRIRVILLLDKGKSAAKIAEYLFLDETTNKEL